MVCPSGKGHGENIKTNGHLLTNINKCLPKERKPDLLLIIAKASIGNEATFKAGHPILDTRISVCPFVREGKGSKQKKTAKYLLFFFKYFYLSVFINDHLHNNFNI